MYRKNIEVITDPAYKKTKRAQIKDLLSLTRMSTYKPTRKTVRRIHSLIADNIINSYTNGDNVGFYENEEKAKDISNSWDFGKDNGKEVSITDDSRCNSSKYSSKRQFKIRFRCS